MKYTQQQFDTALDAYKRVDLTMSERTQLKNRVLDAVAPQHNMYKHASAIKRMIGVGGLLFLSSATLAFGSQYSEPGDVLYGVETGIVEPMIGAVIFNDEDYRDYQTQLALERISEVLGLDPESPTRIQHIARARELFDRHTAFASVDTQDMFEAEALPIAANAKMAMRAEIASDSNLQQESSVNELEVLFALAVAVNQDADFEEGYSVETTDDLRDLAYALDVQSQVQYTQDNHEGLYTHVAEILTQARYATDNKGEIFADSDDNQVEIASLEIAADDSLIEVMSLVSSTTTDEEAAIVELEVDTQEAVSVPNFKETIQVLPRTGTRGL